MDEEKTEAVEEKIEPVEPELPETTEAGEIAASEEVTPEVPQV